MSDEMAYAHVARSGLLVSRIVLGRMNFGFTADEPTSSEIMDAAIEAVNNFVDTADVYGGPQTPDMAKGTTVVQPPPRRPARRRAGSRQRRRPHRGAPRPARNPRGAVPEAGRKLAAVALAWLLRNPAVSAAILGPRTSEELRSSLGALSLQLGWPGPGEAPKAYAG